MSGTVSVADFLKFLIKERHSQISVRLVSCVNEWIGVIIYPMSNLSNLGGARPGAGRPKGAQNRRSRALADKFLGSGKCPAEALVRIAEQAEAAGETALAIDAWKAVLPYVHAKPKAMEVDPVAVVELARDLAEARATGSAVHYLDYGTALARAEENLVEIEIARTSVRR